MPQPTLPAPAVQAVKAALHAIPMNATVGINITDVGPGWATGECPDTPPFRNHLGTIHAGAQFLLAEAVSGAACAGAFAQDINEAVPLIEKLETHYVGRAVGDLTTRAEIDPAALPAAYAEYQADGRAPRRGDGQGRRGQAGDGSTGALVPAPPPTGQVSESGGGPVFLDLAPRLG